MNRSTRTLSRAIAACFVLLTFSCPAFGQGTGTVLPGPWSYSGTCYTPAYDAFQLVYLPSLSLPCGIQDAAMRLTLGVSSSAPIFGQLGVVDTFHDYLTPLPSRLGWFSKFALLDATVLRSSEGDLVLSATTFTGVPTYGPPPPTTASIRFGTTPYPITDTSSHPNDIERMTLWGNGKLAVGTQGVPASEIFGDTIVPGENDLFHLHLPCLPSSYIVDTASGYDTSQLMTLKLSYGGIRSPQLRFAQLGFDRGRQLGAFSSDEDLVLSTNSDLTSGPDGTGRGDIIITNRRIGRAIRFGATPDTGVLPVPGPGVPAYGADIEHVTILSNGNVGIDLPPAVGGLCTPMDQLQLGGGMAIDSAYGAPIPGLTFFGGDRFEGMPRPSPYTGNYPIDWRGIALNHWEDHTTGYAARFAPMPWDQLAFSPDDGGLISLGVFPWHTSDSLTSNDSGVFLQVTGQQGLSMFCYEGDSDPYHHLFDVWRPGFGTNRNVIGLFYHATPVYIGSGAPDFTNLVNVHPDIGDGKTWWLAVNGAALFKEAYVNEYDWPDYVLRAGYKLRSIADFGNYLATEHHLPDIPPAAKMNGAVPLGKTQIELTKQVEELSLYIVQLNKEVEALKTQVEGLKNGKEK